MEKKKYPIGPEFYKLFEEVGSGVSASVHRAQCLPFSEVVAIKILDFERDNCDLNNISREAQTMNLVDHPNVLKSHCSFVSGHNLWVVMPYMSGGSCLNVLKAAYPDGLEEVVIATILREVLKGLDYLHHHGHIHRDVKAGNILIDSRGAIKLGDFGVSACLFDSGDRQRSRNTFVGTPCWMAPEVMEQLHGYDFKADIWSFGITALELAHGHAPFSKYPPMKVLLMTLQNAPPGLDYERDKKFSKSFKQMTASCLVKDPSKRPSAKRLLKHSFFKQARSSDYIGRTLVEGLPALGDRIKELKRKEEDMLAQKKMPDGEKEELSQNEYKRGISGWNFNLEDVKAQASLIPDVEDFGSDFGGSSNSLCGLDVNEKQPFTGHLSQVSEDSDLMQNPSVPLPSVDSAINNIKVQLYKSDDDSSIASSSYEHHISQGSSPRHDGQIETSLGEKLYPEINEKLLDMAIQSQKVGSSSSSTSSPEINCPPVKGESVNLHNQLRRMSSCNGTTVVTVVDEGPSDIISRTCKSSANSDEPDDKAKVPVIQQRGRFKVTSENVGLEKVVPSPVLQKSQSLQVLNQPPTFPFSSPLPSPLPSPSPCEATSSSHHCHFLFPLVNSVLQSNILQRDTILGILRFLSSSEFIASCASDERCMPMHISAIEKSMLEAAHEREKDLLQEVTELHWRLMCAQEEIQKFKTEKAQV